MWSRGYNPASASELAFSVPFGTRIQNGIWDRASCRRNKLRARIILCAHSYNCFVTNVPCRPFPHTVRVPSLSTDYIWHRRTHPHKLPEQWKPKRHILAFKNWDFCRTRRDSSVKISDFGVQSRHQTEIGQNLGGQSDQYNT